MASQIYNLSWLLPLGLICTLLAASYSGAASDANPEAKNYIVYMGDRPKSDVAASSLRTNMLREVLGSNGAPNSLVRSYTRSFNGFVAKLTQEEMHKMAGMEGVVSIFPNEKKQLHTTRSWDFMGFPEKVTRTTIESDIVIGVLDTGIWPESDSFKDEGIGPPPRTWLGTCDISLNFTCNNKLIGAQYYKSDGLFSEEDIKSPRDSEGHGTHTASTVAGSLVSMASLSGLGLGTARGGVPSARIAMYKICWSDGCYDADILAAFDDAIADGVDIISLSVGGSTAGNYFEDSIAIGSFHAMKNGILTSISAGNNGPDPATTTNVSPWSLSVAAGTINRKFFTTVKLGNGVVYQGISVNAFENLNNEIMYPIIYGGDAPNTTGGFQGTTSRLCLGNSLASNIMKGKIVLCDGLNTGRSAFQAGAAGIVMQGSGPKDVADPFPFPASYLGVQNGSSIYNYIKLTSNATAIILKSHEGNDAFAPYVASFSSRGPNPVTSDILKPDLTAPGVNILAAWSPKGPISGIKGDDRVVKYNIISGTSMACPHATAAAAYIKSFHPTWSPAALKSALMTTAFPMSAELNSDAEFAYGAGHINPLKALNPGLVYDAEKLDYIKFLCGEGYTTNLLQLVTGDNSSCSEILTGTVWDLNYPSFSLSALAMNSNITRVFRRTVTNVGSSISTYKATVTGLLGLRIQVVPSILSFTSLGQKLSFSVTIEGTIQKALVSGSLVWDDGVHQVRSPVVVYVSS